MPPFANADAVAALHGDALTQFARAHGNLQSRIDFACYQCGLPALGLTADRPYKRAWAQQNRSWPYPVERMQAAAQARSWTPSDFAQIRAAAGLLPRSAARIWEKELQEREEQVRAWAHSFDGTTATPRAPGPSGKFIRIDWTRDELILALDLYMRDRRRAWDDDDREVIDLSRLLRRLAPLLGMQGGPTFRNANGVAMKLMNLRSLDPMHRDEGRVGLAAASRADNAVWQEFADDIPRLHLLATAIRRAIESGLLSPEMPDDDEVGIAQAPEGRVFTRVHLARERNPRLVKECKRRFLKKHKRLYCEACGFDFGSKYGNDKGGIIDCHHTNPVHTLDAGHQTKVEDLVLLCSNCHRVVHSNRQWLTIPELIRRLEHNGSVMSDD